MAKVPKFKLSVRERDLGWGHIKKEMAKMAKRPFVKVGYQGESGVKKHESKDTFGPPAPNSPTVVDIATFHEFGTETIPERSHLRATMDANRGKYQGQMDTLKDMILDPDSGMTTERALGLMGQMAVADVKATIRAGIDPPLKDSTVRRKNKTQIAKAEGKINQLERTLNEKGRLTKAQKKAENKAAETVLTGGKSTPLIDTGQMINSLQYKVDMSGNLDGATSMIPRKRSK